MVSHLIVFSDTNMGGRHWHIFGDVPNIRDVSFAWDDNISSFVVLGGEWRFYRDKGFAAEVGRDFGPGVYPRMADAGLPNDAISSIRLVG